MLTCLGRFSLDELAKVESIAMDMWEPYRLAFGALVTGADEKIVFDRFHIVGHMNEAVDQVRRRENKGLRAEGDDRLVGSKHLWLFGAENFPLDRYDLETRMDFADLKRSNLKTARAWTLKEMRRGLWKQPSRAAGERWYRRWYSSCANARSRRRRSPTASPRLAPTCLIQGHA